MATKRRAKQAQLTPAVFTMEFFSVGQQEHHPFVICLETKQWFRFEAAQPDDDWEFGPQDFAEIQCQSCPRRHRLISPMQALNWGVFRIERDYALSSREQTRQGRRRGAHRQDANNVTPLHRPIA